MLYTACHYILVQTPHANSLASQPWNFQYASMQKCHSLWLSIARNVALSLAGMCCVQVSIMTRPANPRLQWYQWVHVRTDSTNYNTQVYVLIYTCKKKKWRSHKTNPIMTRSWYISTLSVTYCILQFCSWHANSRATTNSFMLARPNCFKTGCGQRGVLNGMMMNIQTRRAAHYGRLMPLIIHLQYTFKAYLMRS